MKHQCTNCDEIYGDGPQTNPKKMQRGFCNDCWNWLLAVQRLNARQQRNRRQAAN